MLGTLNQVIEWIQEDPIVAGNVSLYSPNEGEPGVPAVVFQTAPPDMIMPYVVTYADINNAEDNDFIDRTVYTVHVFADNGDIVTANTIAKRIESILDRTRLPLDLGIGMWRDSAVSILPENDPGIIHYVQRFIIRQF